MRPVLIVDDEPLVRVTLRSTVDWAKWGYVCAAEASNGEEALAVLKEHPETALVMLDMVMPRMGGLDFLRALRGRGSPPQVIVLTAHDEFSLVREAFKLGAADYILKSELEPDRLASLLEAAQKRAARFGGAADTAGHAVALKQEALRLLLEAERWGPLRDDLRARGIELGAALRLGLLTVRDFEVVAARYGEPSTALPGAPAASPGAAARSSFPLGLITVTEQVMERHEPAGLHAYILRTRDDEYAIFVAFIQRHASTRIAEETETLASDMKSAAAEYMNVAVDISWSDVCLPDAGPGPASLYRALTAGRPRPSRLVERAFERIRESLPDPGLSLGTLSQELGVTPNHLSTLFTRETGRSFREYVAFVRVEAAKRLLAGSTLKVWEVAEKVGFASVEHFSRVFKKLTGVAPHLFTREPRP